MLLTPLGANERRLMNIVRQHGTVARHKIVEQMDVTAQAVGQITKRLDQYNLLLHHKAVTVGLGQPPKPISIRAEGAYSMGIKLGRRHTDVVLVDLLGQVRERHSIVYAAPVVRDVLPRIAQHITQLQTQLEAQGGALTGVGVAAPFALGGWHKLLGLSQEQADEWHALDLVAAVQAMTPRPVRLAKDTAAACIAELLNGQGRQTHNFLYIFIDTFVGGGVVHDGRWLATTHGNAGAIASVPMQTRLPADQLLDHASIWELEERLHLAGLDPAAAYDQRALQPNYLAHTEAWLDAASHSLAFAIVSGTALLDTDAVVIDGSIDGQLLAQLMAKTQLALDDFNWESLWRPQLLKGLVGADAGALGGALLPLHEYFYAL